MSDLALVQIVSNDAPLPPLPILELSSSDSIIRAGEWVVALGSPLSLQNSVSCGIVSAVARHSSELGLAQHHSEFIQTDAAVNHGNSGGPLVNLAGQVVGINALKVASGDGISFAIPVNVASEVLGQLQQHRRVIRPCLGMQLIQPQLGQVVVKGLSRPDAPAAKAGIERGDVIVSFDGQAVHSTKDITSQLGYEVGRTIDVVIQRQSKELKVQITTEELKTNGSPRHRFYSRQ